MTDLYQKIDGKPVRLDLGYNVLPVRAVEISDGFLVLDIEAGSDMSFAINDAGMLEVEYA